ncbi:cyclic pyranopterin monophosphate synthase MoaC [Streptomyces tricolor]|nr:cyclic pyranopterin monophosphate synthase MoaC [Streptomyces tricolor]
MEIRATVKTTDRTGVEMEAPHRRDRSPRSP